jgi:spore maturation protein CgeB
MKSIYLYSAFALILILITVNFIAGTSTMAFITQVALAGFAAFAASEIAKSRNNNAEEELNKLRRDISSLRNLIEKSIAKSGHNIENVKSEVKSLENFVEEKSRLTERKLSEKIDNLKQAEKEYRIKFDDDLETLNRIVTQSRENVNSIKSETGEKHRQIESSVAELRASLGNGISSKIVNIENTIHDLVENFGKQDESIIDNLANDFSKLKSNSEDFKKKINELEFKLNRKTDISHTNSQVSGLKSSIDEMNAALKIIKDENKWGVESFTQLKNDIYSFRENVISRLDSASNQLLEKQVNDLTNELDKISFSIKQINDQKIQGLESQIGKLKESDKFLVREIDKNRSDIEPLTETVGLLDSKIDKFNNYVDKSLNSIKEKFIVLESLKQDSLKNNNKFTSLIKKIELINKEKNATLEQLSQRVNEQMKRFVEEHKISLANSEELQILNDKIENIENNKLNEINSIVENINIDDLLEKSRDDMQNTFNEIRESILHLENHIDSKIDDKAKNKIKDLEKILIEKIYSEINFDESIEKLGKEFDSNTIEEIKYRFNLINNLIIKLNNADKNLINDIDNLSNLYKDVSSKIEKQQFETHDVSHDYDSLVKETFNGRNLNFAVSSNLKVVGTQLKLSDTGTKTKFIENRDLTPQRLIYPEKEYAIELFYMANSDFILSIIYSDGNSIVGFEHLELQAVNKSFMGKIYPPKKAKYLFFQFTLFKNTQVTLNEIIVADPEKNEIKKPKEELAHECKFDQNYWTIQKHEKLDIAFENNSLVAKSGMGDNKKYIYNGGPKWVNNLPVNPEEFAIEPDTFYEIQADYNIANNVHLWFGTYNDKKQLQAMTFTLKASDNNAKIKFKTEAEARYFRIALRFSGDGSFNIKKLQIFKTNEELYEEELNKKVLRDLNPKLLKGASIMDVFTTKCFEDEYNMVRYRPDNWQETMNRFSPDFLFVESAWQGNEGAWQYRVATYQKDMGQELPELINYCKENNIPTAFWNKEDPVHFDRFIENASKFDYIFTTDADCIDDYKKHSGHDNCFALPFAAQPSIHNPVQDVPRDGNICFAGTYYGNRHEERRLDMEFLLRPSIEYGLDIYDRQFGLVGDQAKLYRFPDIYQNSIKGKLNYDEMIRAYKRYKIFLNVNSVKYSPTMFSRRVFELLASGTPVISTYSKGIVELIGEDIVFITESEAQTKEYIEKLLGDEIYWKKMSYRGINKILNEHTYNHRFNFMANKMELEKKFLKKPAFTVIAQIENDFQVEIIESTLNKQTYNDFDILLTVGKDVSDSKLVDFKNKFAGRKTVIIKETLQTVAGRLYDNVNNKIVFIDSKNYYSKNYLLDFALMFEFGSNIGLFGKHSRFRYKSEHKLEKLNFSSDYNLVKECPLASSCIDTNFITRNEFLNSVTEKKLNFAGRRILSLHPFNFIESTTQTVFDNDLKAFVSI